MLGGRVVLVTGAGGCVGGELCRQIMTFGPRLLVLVDQYEGHLFEIERELFDAGFDRAVVSVLADVRDLPRMHDIFEKYQPEIVFHTAALSQVTVMERHPGEAIENNTLGAVVVATLALEFLADRFVLISADQAAQPTNVMGATQRLAEIFVQALSAGSNNRTKFMSVRFGSIVESGRGVVTDFRRQIAAGGPVRVTDPNATGRFIGRAESVQLILLCGARGRGEEVFSLSTAFSLKMVEVARRMIA